MEGTGPDSAPISKAQLPTPKRRSQEALGVYVHVPFCSSICNYCNFNRGLYDEALKTRYVSALRTEIAAAKAAAYADVGRRFSVGASESTDVGRAFSVGESESADVGRRFSVGASDSADIGRAFSVGESESADAGRRFSVGASDSADVGRRFSVGRAADTIFFGGGTPSLLEPSEIASIIRTVRDTFDLANDAEITLETNPETVDQEKLERFREAGVNRLSFGVQSFHDSELKRLGRIHSADRARAAVAEARGAGFANISLDLMMWLPGQGVASWLQNVDALIEASPDHASLYLLELYPNAPLKEDMARAGWSQAPDEDAAEMYLTAMERLETAGLNQYEISNVARPGRASRHNLKYWTDGEWLGFGCGAHSTMGGVRWKNVSGTEDYIRRVTGGGDVVSERRAMALEERLEEALFTGLRLSEGIDADAVGRRYGIDTFEKYGEALRPFLDAKWLVREGGRLRLTRDGMLMANEVMAVFV